MNKPFVISCKEMKERITFAVNSSINEVPADVIADFLERLLVNLRNIAEEQLNEATKQYEGESSEQSKTE